jgi:hypothetical protein
MVDCARLEFGCKMPFLDVWMATIYHKAGGMLKYSEDLNFAGHKNPGAKDFIEVACSLFPVFRLCYIGESDNKVLKHCTRLGEAMDFKKHLETAWNLTLKHIVPLILMTLVSLAVSLLTIGVLGPVIMAGFIQSIILMMREERAPRIEDLFSQMRLFLPLLAFSIAVGLAVLVGAMFFILPGLAIALAVTFGCLYLLPLMTDRRMGLIEAVKTSWQMALQGSVADHIVVVILFVGLMAVGGSVFFGILFTQPFAMVFLVSVYLERIDTPPAGFAQAPPPPENTGPVS